MNFQHFNINILIFLIHIENLLLVDKRNKCLLLIEREIYRVEAN